MIEQDSIAGLSFAVPEERAADVHADIRQESTLLELLTELARRKALIAKITAAAIAIGIVLSLVLPVRYTATTRIMPPQQTPSAASMFMTQFAGGNSSPLAALTGGGLSLKNPNDLYVGLLQSNTIADALIHQFDLARDYRARDLTAARKTLASDTAVVSEKSGLIAISVTDKDKNRAAAMANAYTSQLRALTQSMAVTEASQRRMFYEDQLKEAKEALVGAELAFQQVQQQKGLVALDAQAKAMIESLTALRAQVAAKQVEVQALRSFSTEQNPEVQLAEQELSTLRAEAARMEQSGHSQGLGSLDLADVPSAGLDYLRAQHELLYRQTLYDLLIKQYDAARLDESKEAAIIQVVEPAIEPDRRSSPKRMIIVLGSAITMFFLACIFVIVCKSIRNLDQEHQQQLSALRTSLFGR
jgi:tyrosine-protein kinase Etk/Wzc